jgi:hypothetical protein
MLALGLTAALIFSNAAFTQDKDKPAAKEPTKEDVEKVIKDQIAIMSDLTTVLETVKDKASVEKAKPKLEAVAKRLKDLGDRAKKLGNPSKEVLDEVGKKYQEKSQAVTGKFRKEIERVSADADLKKALEYLKPKPTPAKDKPVKDKPAKDK